MTGTAATSPGQLPQAGSGHDTVTVLEASSGPFRGLTPYTVEDADYFFGRDGDRDLVIANLMASRLTVLYGPSGVGKSSLIQAGVLRQLHELSGGGFSYLAENQAVVVYHTNWNQAPLASLGAAVIAAIGTQVADELAVPPGTPLSVELLQHVTERLGADVYLLCDQFEEFALYQTGEDVEDFAAELGRIVSAPGLRASVLIGIRDDAFAKLDRFTAHVPGILDNYLRLDHLRPEAAREAIERPVSKYNEDADPRHRMDIESGLVEELLTQLRTGEVAVSDVGRGGAIDSGTIETPYLQLVMTRLWAAETADGSHTLRRATLDRLGGAEGIVRSHLDMVMDRLPESQREQAAEMLRYLVTPSGTKIANSAEALAHFAGLPGPEALTDVLEALSGGRERILRPIPAPLDRPGPPRYEVFHDVLGPAVLEWRRRYIADRERAEGEAKLTRAKEEAEARAKASRQELRRTRLVAAVLVVLLIAVAGLAAGVKRIADSDRMQAHLGNYQYQLEQDPAAALHEALQAYDARATPETEAAVRTALAADTSDRILDRQEGIAWAAGYSTDGTQAVVGGQHGDARLIDTATGNLVREFPPEDGEQASYVTDAVLNDDGTLLALSTHDGWLRIVETATGKTRMWRHVYAASTATMWTTVAGQELLLASAYWDDDPEKPYPAKLYDPATGELVQIYGADVGAHWASPSHDGSRIVSVDWETRVSVWDTATGKLISRSELLGINATQPMFVTTADDRVALAVQGWGIGLWYVTFWDWREGSTTEAVQKYDDWAIQIPIITVSPDRTRVAASLDKSAVVLTAEEGGRASDIPQQPVWVNDLAFSPDGTLLVTGTDDGQAQVWRRASGNTLPLARLLGHQGGVTGVSFDPDDSHRLLTTSTDGTARTWKLPSSVVFPSGYTAAGGWNVSAELSRDGQYVLTGLYGNWSAIWRADGEEQIKAIEIPENSGYGTLRSATLTPDGETIVATTSLKSAPYTVHWSTWDTGTEPTFMEDSGYYLTAVAVSEDAQQIAAGTYSNQVFLWDRTSRKITESPLPSVPGEGLITSLGYVPGSELLAAASSDGTVRIWDPTAPDQPKHTIKMPSQAAVTSIDVTADGAYLATVSEDGRLRIWSIANGTTLKDFAGPAAGSTSAAFSPDGRLLAVGVGDGSVHVYDWDEEVELGSMRRHGGTINSVRFLDDGSTLRILTASDDGTSASYPCTVCQPIEELLPEARAKDRQAQQS